MKHGISLIMAILIGLAGSAFAQHEPPGGWPGCSGCLYAAHWLGAGDPVWDTCNYTACGGDCEIISGAIQNTTGTISLVIANEYVSENHKSLYIRCEGTGATTPPHLDTIIAAGVGQVSVVQMQPPVVTMDGGGNWSIEIHAVIFPQPQSVIAEIVVGDAQLTEAWAWECCTGGSLPSITPYGMALLAVLLIISSVWIYLRRRRNAIANA